MTNTAALQLQLSRPSSSDMLASSSSHHQQLTQISQCINDGVDALSAGDFLLSNRTLVSTLKNLRTIITGHHTPTSNRSSENNSITDVHAIPAAAILLGNLDSEISAIAPLFYGQARKVHLDDASLLPSCPEERMQTNLHSLSSVLIYNIALLYQVRALASTVDEERQASLIRSKALYERAQQLLDQAAEADPTRMAGISNNLAHIYCCLEDHEAAVVCCHDVLVFVSSWDAATKRASLNGNTEDCPPHCFLESASAILERVGTEYTDRFRAAPAA